MIEVDPGDPAFSSPTKPIGPVYDRAGADALAADRGWTFLPDGDGFRRVVPSPAPKRIFELRQIRWLLERGAVVICAGGGGIPTAFVGERLVGVEAVIDKDWASQLLATQLDADLFVMATDADAVFLDWGSPTARPIARAHPDALAARSAHFPDGSMGPKVAAACAFARSAPGARAVIGGLADIEAVIAGTAGTTVTTDAEGIELRPTT
jgi:carbamate kinase